MRKIFPILIFIILLITSANAQNLRVDIQGWLSGTSRQDIFIGQLVLPIGQTREIFTGPYTLGFSADKLSSGEYVLNVKAYGLPPDYRNFDHKPTMAVGKADTLSLLPVKNDYFANYRFVILDDTTKLQLTEPDISDTTKWGTSETIHYNTHWLYGSLADFMWNIKMGYLEQIYDKYRTSFGISEFEKIELYFHPERDNSYYINPITHYAIQPRTRRIDLIYNHNIDAADPIPAAEMLIYRMWGYGPPWMAAGFAEYYFDDHLRVRDYITRFPAKRISTLLSDESWVESDTGRQISGALAHWLIDTESVTKFTRLYKQSTSSDFAEQFKNIYGRSIESALDDFISFIKKLDPKPVELDYYATLYLAQGHYSEALKYYEELANINNKDHARFIKPLATCQFWTGDYKAAASTMSRAEHPDSSLENNYLLADFLMADGKIDWALKMYHELSYGSKYNPAKFRLTSILLDQGKIDSARALLNGIDEKSKSTLEYYLALGRISLMTNQPADSILAIVAVSALRAENSIPQEPANYLLAGKALMLLGRYDDAKENLEISNFLDGRPFYIGATALELGRLMDLQGNREKAREYYSRVLSTNSGAYEKSLARKYLEKGYSLR